MPKALEKFVVLALRPQPVQDRQPLCGELGARHRRREGAEKSGELPGLDGGISACGQDFAQLGDGVSPQPWHAGLQMRDNFGCVTIDERGEPGVEGKSGRQDLRAPDQRRDGTIERFRDTEILSAHRQEGNEAGLEAGCFPLLRPFLYLEGQGQGAQGSKRIDGHRAAVGEDREPGREARAP